MVLVTVDGIAGIVGHAWGSTRTALAGGVPRIGVENARNRGGAVDCIGTKWSGRVGIMKYPTEVRVG
jgi:hypothetical protein